LTSRTSAPGAAVGFTTAIIVFGMYEFLSGTLQP
jgi:hypothetical protein